MPVFKQFEKTVAGENQNDKKRQKMTIDDKIYMIYYQVTSINTTRILHEVKMK